MVSLQIGKTAICNSVQCFHRRTILIAFIFACCLTTTRGSLIFLSFLLLKFSHFNIFSRLFSARQHFLGYRISPFTIVHKPPMHKTESARQAMHTQNYSHVLNSWQRYLIPILGCFITINCFVFLPQLESIVGNNLGFVCLLTFLTHIYQLKSSSHIT